MTTLTCEYVRDVYPDLLHGKLDPQLTLAVQQHVSTCAECRQEAALLGQLFAASTRVPPDLATRVSTAVREPQRQGRGRSAFLRAAAVAAALVGGALVVSRLPRDNVAPSGLGVITVEAALVSGTGSLQDLSVEQLEQLLGEIES